MSVSVAMGMVIGRRLLKYHQSAAACRIINAVWKHHILVEFRHKKQDKDRISSTLL